MEIIVCLNSRITIVNGIGNIVCLHESLSSSYLCMFIYVWQGPSERDRMNSAPIITFDWHLKWERAKACTRCDTQLTSSTLQALERSLFDNVITYSIESLFAYKFPRMALIISVYYTKIGSKRIITVINWWCINILEVWSSSATPWMDGI